MTSPSVVFLDTTPFRKYDYGPAHPLRMVRLHLAQELMRLTGLLDRPEVRVVAPEPAPLEAVLGFHTRDYVDVLQRVDRGEHPPEAARHGLGWGDNPAFPGVWEGSVLDVGATLRAARAVAGGEARVAFNMAGGLHHALPDRASGFCYLNDPVIAIQWLLSQGKRVAYVDVDAHHADGVQWAFYRDPRVLTLSFHETGEALFPGSGHLEELGEGDGFGFSVNVPLPPGTGDEGFLRAFEGVAPPLLEGFRPDVLVTQLGVDTLGSDPLAHLELTNRGFCRVVAFFRETGLPWVALGGGGYDVTSVARAWCLALGVMLGVALPDSLPPEARLLLRPHGYEAPWLRDPPPRRRERKAVLEAVDLAVAFVRERVFPVHGVGECR